MNNRLNTMISILNSNGNPRIFVEQRIKSNPAYQQMYRKLNDEFIKSGLTQEQFIFNLFEKNGINAEQVKTLAQRLNI